MLDATSVHVSGTEAEPTLFFWRVVIKEGRTQQCLLSLRTDFIPSQYAYISVSLIPHAAMPGMSAIRQSSNMMGY